MAEDGHISIETAGVCPVWCCSCHCDLDKGVLSHGTYSQKSIESPKILHLNRVFDSEFSSRSHQILQFYQSLMWFSRRNHQILQILIGFSSKNICKLSINPSATLGLCPGTRRIGARGIAAIDLLQGSLTWNLLDLSRVIVHNWLVVSSPLKNMSSSIGMMTFPVCGKIKNAPNHQPIISQCVEMSNFPSQLLSRADWGHEEFVLEKLRLFCWAPKFPKLSIDRKKTSRKLVIQHSYWKWPFIMSCPIKKCDFP